MGLFNFIKSAGKKLGIGGDDEAPDAEAVQKELASHGLGTDAVKVEVVLKGTVKDQSIFEKAVVAVGNTLGIFWVEAAELTIAETPEAARVAAKEPASTRSRRATISGRSPRRSMARARRIP